MEKKQLLIISSNSDFSQQVGNEAQAQYSVATTKSIHTGYSMALNYLPDVILIDYASLGLESLKNLQSFKSTHFLNKSFLFLFGDQENKKILDKNFKDQVDGILYDHSSYKELLEEIDHTISRKRCLTNYWKDSFMGLFNLLGNPVLLLQDEKVVAMNDAFKKDFFITGRQQVLLTDLVEERNRVKVREALRKFIKGKHMKTSTTTFIVMKGKRREARISFSKLDKNLRGQMVMMINFTGKEIPLNDEVGTVSTELDSMLAAAPQVEENGFTKREKEVISLLIKGYKTKEISEALCISSKTIEKHRANIIRRTQSGTILESIVYALNHKMIEV